MVGKEVEDGVLYTNALWPKINSHLINHCSVVSEVSAAERASEASRAERANEASDRVSGASERANGRASGPVPVYD